LKTALRQLMKRVSSRAVERRAKFNRFADIEFHPATNRYDDRDFAQWKACQQLCIDNDDDFAVAARP